jgi:hypothetical protein
MGAAYEVTKRLDLLAGLRHFNYDADVSLEFREVDQLHPFIKDNTWAFGESWQLTARERSLKTIIRSVTDSDVVLEDVLAPFLAEPVEGDRRRIDLLLQRTDFGPGNVKHRLGVELKRTSVKLGFNEAQQITGYTTRLTEHAGLGTSNWTFILVGSEKKDELRPQLNQPNREKGEFMRGPEEKFSVFVTTWGELIDDCEDCYRYYRDQLKSSATFDDSVLRRDSYSHLLPGQPD